MGDHGGGHTSSSMVLGDREACRLGLTVGRKNSSHLASICAFMVGEGIFS